MALVTAPSAFTPEDTNLPLTPPLASWCRWLQTLQVQFQVPLKVTKLTAKVLQQDCLSSPEPWGSLLSDVNKEFAS